VSAPDRRRFEDANQPRSRKKTAIAGATLFLLLLVALGLWLYGEELSRTNTAAVMLCATIARKAAVLIACTITAAFVLFMRRYLHSAETQRYAQHGSKTSQS